MNNSSGVCELQWIMETTDLWVKGNSFSTFFAHQNSTLFMTLVNCLEPCTTFGKLVQLCRTLCKNVQLCTRLYNLRQPFITIVNSINFAIIHYLLYHAFVHHHLRNLEGQLAFLRGIRMLLCSEMYQN